VARVARQVVTTARGASREEALERMEERLAAHFLPASTAAGVLPDQPSATGDPSEATEW
jgi:hypothetical protein